MTDTGEILTEPKDWRNPLLWAHDFITVVPRPLENEAFECIKRLAAQWHLQRLQRIAQRDLHYALNMPELYPFQRIERVAKEFGITKEAVVNALNEYDRLLEAV